MKIYHLVNSNGEGFNIQGTYDTLEQARKERDAYNEERLAEVRDLFADDEPNLISQLEFERWWHFVGIYEAQMNTRCHSTKLDEPRVYTKVE